MTKSLYAMLLLLTMALAMSLWLAFGKMSQAKMDAGLDATTWLVVLTALCGGIALWQWSNRK